MAGDEPFPYSGRHTLEPVAGGMGVLILLVGAPGAGKSTLARRLQSRTSAELVQTDRVRKQLFPEPRYTGGEHAAVYGWCHNLIRSCLVAGRSVIFDATNLEEHGRRRLYEIVEATGARMVVVWAACPPRVVQQRMIRRREEPDEENLSDADWDIYLQLRRKADPIRRPHIVANTTVDLEQVVGRVLALAEWSVPGRVDEPEWVSVRRAG